MANLLDVIRRQMLAGVEYIQIREKDLPARDVFEFTQAVLAMRGNAASKVLINERADIAIAAGADGVHLPASAPNLTWPGLVVGRSCHTVEEVRRAGADFVTFGPVFESPGKGAAVGLDLLREACRTGPPVFALGGVTWQNAAACIEAGAAGVSGIRLFLSDQAAV